MGQDDCQHPLTDAIAHCGTCAFEGLFLAQATAHEKGQDQSKQFLCAVGPQPRLGSNWPWQQNLAEPQLNLLLTPQI